MDKWLKKHSDYRLFCSVAFAISHYEKNIYIKSVFYISIKEIVLIIAIF